MQEIQQYRLKNIKHIPGVDHPESISVGPDGTPYTTGTGGQVYRIDLRTNTAKQFASTAPRRMLGQALDKDHNLYCADTTGKVIRITPEGVESTYATAPGGAKFLCTNYLVFGPQGNLYISDSGDWSDQVNGAIYEVLSGGGEARFWYPQPVDTPNGMALGPEDKYLYFVETWGNSVSRIPVRPDGTAGEIERVLHMPRTILDSVAFDTDGRLWIACHRPDAIWTFDLSTRRLTLFAEDWKGEALRGPTDVAFAGPARDILLASSLDNLVVHRFDETGVHGLPLHFPKIS